MTLIIGIVALGNGGKESLQQAQGIVQPFFDNGFVQQSHGGETVVGVSVQIIGKQALHQSDAHFLIGNVECIKHCQRRVVLYGDIATLVEQRGNIRHPFRWSIESCGKYFPSSYLLGSNAILVQHFYQIGRRATAEPIRVHLAIGKSIQQAEWIV